MFTEYQERRTGCVLIETYWNVNQGEKGADGADGRSLNRNILECKSVYQSQIYRAKQVLIETYWNVNKGETGEKGDKGES